MKYRYFYVLLLIAVILPGITLAQANLNTDAKSTGGLLYWFASFMGRLVQFFSAFANWSLNLSNGITSSPLVTTGWGITRDIANLGFVFAIILIAFGTIFRIEGYAVKQTLANLIIAALLVNFSLVIQGVILDFSGALSNYFLSITANPNALAEGLVNAMGVQNILKAPGTIDITASILTGLSSTVIEFLTGLAFVVIFTGLSALTMATLGVLFFLRYLILSFLFITAPITWMVLALPVGKLKGLWAKWWDAFFAQAFFAPAALFFVYLAILAQKTSDASTFNMTAISQNQISGFFDFQSEAVGRLILTIGILMGGLIVAQKMSGTLGSAVIGFMGKAKGVVLGAGLTAGTLGLSTPAGKRFLATVGSKGGTEKSWMQKISTGLSSLPIPGAKTLGTGLAKMTRNLAQDTQKYQEENVAPLSNDALVARANNRLFKTSQEEAAIARELAKRKDKNGISLTDKQYIPEDRLANYLKSAEKLGAAKEILSSRPDLATYIDKAPQDYVLTMKEEDVANPPIQLFEKIEVVEKMKEGHVRKFAALRNDEDQPVLIKTIEKGIEEELAKTETDRVRGRLEKLRSLSETIRKSPPWIEKVRFEVLKPILTKNMIRKIQKEEGFEEEKPASGGVTPPGL